MKLPQAPRVADGASLVPGLLGVSSHSSLCTSKWKPKVLSYELIWVVLKDFYSFMEAPFVPFSFTLIAFLSLSVAATLQFLQRLVLPGIILYSPSWFSIAQSFQFLLSFSSINCLCEFLPQYFYSSLLLIGHWIHCFSWFVFLVSEDPPHLGFTCP